MPKIYQWLVVDGRVAIWSEGTKVVLELSPDGLAHCVLSAQDARDISGIMTEQARAIWDSSDKSPESPAEIDGDHYQKCTLIIDSTVLRAVIHDSQPLIALSLDTGTVARMNVTQAVALIQILQCMDETLQTNS